MQTWLLRYRRILWYGSSEIVGHEDVGNRRKPVITPEFSRLALVHVYVHPKDIVTPVLIGGQGVESHPRF